MYTVRKYANHLYKDRGDGYIQVVKLDKNKNFSVLTYIDTASKEDLLELKKFKGMKDVYITPNTFYIPYRSGSNIRHYRSLFIDIDLKKYSLIECYYEIFNLVNENKIPRPTLIINSGRGLHLYWRILNAPKQAFITWQALEDMLYYRLKFLGADKKATDGARLLRVPYTINSKNDAQVEIIYSNDNYYSMYELRDNFLDYKKKNIDKSKADTKLKVIKNAFFNSYSLHFARLTDIETLCRLRNYDIKGYRNSFMHLFVYWKGIYTRDNEELLSIALEFNSLLVEPLKLSEVRSIVRSCNKAIERYISYTQGKLNKDVRFLTDKTKRLGYWYKNSTLIELLDISVKEQGFLKTIISKEVKYNRNNLKRRKSRRNEEGLTKKQEELKLLKEKVQALRAEGLSIRDIASKLNISKTKIGRLLN